MNKFVCYAVIDEVDIKKGSYTTKMWADGKKTDKDITVNTLRGKMSVMINDNSFTLRIDATDKSIFTNNGEQPRTNKNYDNISKFMKNYDERPIGSPMYVKISGEAIDNPYYSATQTKVVEVMDFRADFITVLSSEPEEMSCYLQATTYFLGSEEEDENSDMYKLKGVIAPAWGTKYFPVRSNKDDARVYITEDYLDGLKELISEDGDEFTSSALITYKLCFRHMGGASKKISGKGFGNARTEMFASRGWDVPYLMVDGGTYIEPIIDYNEDDEEVCKNAKDIIFKKDINTAIKARKERLNGLKDEYEAWQKKKNSVKAIDNDDLGDIPF